MSVKDFGRSCRNVTEMRKISSSTKKRNSSRSDVAVAANIKQMWKREFKDICQAALEFEQGDLAQKMAAVSKFIEEFNRPCKVQSEMGRA